MNVSRTGAQQRAMQVRQQMLEAARELARAQTREAQKKAQDDFRQLQTQYSQVTGQSPNQVSMESFAAAGVDPAQQAQMVQGGGDMGGPQSFGAVQTDAMAAVGGPGGAGKDPNKILEFFAQNNGKPYQWGGNGPADSTAPASSRRP